MSKKEVAKIVEAELPTLDSSSIWGAADNIGSEDLLVGKIFHQQALSKFVQEGKAQAGDWCDSLTGEVLAKKDQPMPLIIFASYKKLLISESKLSNGKFDFVRSDDVTPANCNLPWEEETPTGTIKRQLQYNYFCLLPGKILELPYILSLSSTKIKAAKKLNTMIAKLSRMNMPSASYVFNLHSIKETGDKGSWFGADITQGEKVTADQLAIAHDWYSQIKTQKVIVAEEPEAQSNASQSGPTGETQNLFSDDQIPF
jgi:hypothetical protein